MPLPLMVDSKERGRTLSESFAWSCPEARKDRLSAGALKNRDPPDESPAGLFCKALSHPLKRTFPIHVQNDFETFYNSRQSLFIMSLIRRFNRNLANML